MTRSEFVRLLVLNSICDDFENVDQVILRDVAETGAKCGLTIERAEVVDALASLVSDGLAKAYILPGPTSDAFSGELQSMPALTAVEEHFRTYFYITKQGMNLHLANEAWWPLDDDGNIKEGWQLAG